MGFVFFILANTLMFLQPAAFYPELAEWSLYQYTILIALACSLPAALRMLDPRVLERQPVTVCVIGLQVAVVLSHLLFRFNFYDARISGIAFSKLLVYYIVLVSTVNSPGRLRFFLSWLLFLIFILACLALLHYTHVINIESLQVMEERDIDDRTGEVRGVYRRLQSIGEFNDPNDFSLILVAGIGIALYFLGNGTGLVLRSLQLLPIGLLGYCVFLTQSRGGLIALVSGLLTFFWARFGRWKSILLTAALLPAILYFAGDRQSGLLAATLESTGQTRIQLWAEALDYFKSAPFFGIGHGNYLEEIHHVTHNSFLHCFAELGLFGGVFFLGAFYSAARSLYRLEKDIAPPDSLSPELQPMWPYLLSVIVSYAAGLLTLSRAFVLEPYIFLGLSTAYVEIVQAHSPVPVLRFDRRLYMRFVLLSGCFLVGTYLLVRTLSRWGS
jgi:hypothetical protein